MEKNEIVKLFLESGVQLTPEALEIIFHKQDIIDKLINIIKEKNIILLDEKNLNEFIGLLETKDQEVKIEYPEELVEFKTDDVLRLMKERFEVLSKIIEENHKLQNIVSLSKIKKVKRKEEVITIGMVKDKTTYSILLEDFTSNEIIQMEANIVKRIFYDDVIGVRIKKEGEQVIGDKIFFPSLSFFRKTCFLSEEVLVSKEWIKFKDKKIPIERREIVKVYINNFKLTLIDVDIIKKYRVENENYIDILISLIERRHLNPSFFISKKVYKKDLFLLNKIPDVIIVFGAEESIFKVYKGINIFFLPNGKVVDLKRKKIE